ncbi:hypothetical protein [Pareuzebyella sediminis]|uniref:hypothetical protein n=1 Tax=Pareuzebyella sediminis TaxID=2607998 RepID=UPI0011EE726B|nr:hypothetical protein [Pareuzebyella sediminis]
METIKPKLGQVGLVLAAMGLISALLSIFNYNIRLLAWIDSWGSTMGWGAQGSIDSSRWRAVFLFGRAEE